ncbi:hypothetical protein pb186bvf_016482 [Paramecium bursaria]
MQEIKYLKDAFVCIVDKFVLLIDNPQCKQFWNGYKSQIMDNKTSSLELLLQAQKFVALKTPSPVKSSSRLPSQREIFKPNRSSNFLRILQNAQSEMRNNTQTFTALYNSIQENVVSQYMTQREAQKLIFSIQNTSSKKVEKSDKSELEELKRISVYGNQRYSPNVQLLNRVDKYLDSIKKTPIR